MEALDHEKLPVVRKTLDKPDINDIVKALSKDLTKNFSEVSVDFVECPDLTKKPFSLVCPGLGGASHLFDIGGVPYLLPLAQKEKVYNIPQICKLSNIEPMYTMGAGAGPWPHLGVNCEGIFNLGVVNGEINQQSRIASIKIPAEADKSGFKLEILPSNEARCALLANIFTTQGKPGKVLRIECKTRIGDDDYITSIRKCLHENFKGKFIGLGGTFLLNEGSAKLHIMPDFSKIPLHSDDDVNNWLKFFNMAAPLISVGTLLSDDPDLDLRIQHFHTFSHHGEGGHYHIDVTPSTAHYIGYFTMAESIIRVDAPEVTHNIGRD